MKKCLVPLCNNKYYGKGYCGKHYMQIKQNGKILERTYKDKQNDFVEKENCFEIILRNIKCEEVGRTLLNKEDFEKVIKYKIGLDSLGYATMHINNKPIRLHVFLLGKKQGFVTDHINYRNRLDNRRENLRFVNRRQNNINKGLQNNNKSGFKGVFWYKRGKKWEVSIGINCKTTHIGSFKSLHQAVLMRTRAEIIYFIFNS